MTSRLFFGQIRKEIDLEIQGTSIADIGTVSIAQVAMIGMNLEFGPGSQIGQLDFAFLFRQASFSGTVGLSQPGLLIVVGGFGEDEGIIDDDWGFILIDEDSFVIWVFQVLMGHRTFFEVVFKRYASVKYRS